VTFDSSNVEGHELEWNFRYWADIEPTEEEPNPPPRDPENEEPDWDSSVDGYSSSLYGTLTDYSGATGSNGYHTATYTTGSKSGWVFWWARDTNANEYQD
jgi:hypothetical protein